MTLPELKDLIEVIGTQATIVGSGLMVAYFKLKKQFDKKIQEVKTHTSISVQKLNGMLSYVINSFDRPAWIKVAHVRDDGEIEFRMLEVNSAYTSVFGIERKNYLGKTDLEAGWTKDAADLFRKHDLAVWASGEPETFVEPYSNSNMRFRKIRVQSSDGTLKGVMGYAVECNSPSTCPYWSDCFKCNPKNLKEPNTNL